MKIGLHVSISGSIDRSVDNALKLGCKTFQIFTRNPRGWNTRILDEKEIDLFIEKCKRNNYSSPIVHMPYLPNLSSSSDENYFKSINTLRNELERCDKLKVKYLVTHLGSHLGKGEMFGLKRVINACNMVLEKNENKVKILLENTAGTKNSVGYKFENLKYVLDNVNIKDRVGICFDTAHAFAAGYDLRTVEDVKRTFRLLTNNIEEEKIKVIHLNDSKGFFNSHSDRHYHIGLGNIGKTGIKAILNHEVVRYLPIILETPIDNVCDDLGNIKAVNKIINEN